jgi:hypothetical protein
MKMLLPEMLLPGLLLSNRSLGAVTIFGGDGVFAAIGLCGLLSVCWLLLAAGDAEAFVGWLLSVCRLLLVVGDACCTVAFWLLLLYPTARCLGLGHSEH